MQGVHPAAKVRPTSQGGEKTARAAAIYIDAALLIEPAQAKHPGNVEPEYHENRPADVAQVIGVPLNCPADEAD